MIPMLFPHASSVFSHGSPNLSLTTLQYCHFDHAKRPQQHEPSVLPSHSPPTSPGRHWGSRHLRIVSAGSWINKDQVAKLQRKKNKFSRSCYSPVLLNQNIYANIMVMVSTATPIIGPSGFFWGGVATGQPSQIHRLLTCPSPPRSLPRHQLLLSHPNPALKRWRVGPLTMGPWLHPNDVGRLTHGLEKNLQITHDFCKEKMMWTTKSPGNYVFHPLIFRGVHSPDLSWKLNMMIYP